MALRIARGTTEGRGQLISMFLRTLMLVIDDKVIDRAALG